MLTFYDNIYNMFVHGLSQFTKKVTLVNNTIV